MTVTVTVSWIAFYLNSHNISVTMTTWELVTWYVISKGVVVIWCLYYGNQHIVSLTNHVSLLCCCHYCKNWYNSTVHTPCYFSFGIHSSRYCTSHASWLNAVSNHHLLRTCSAVIIHFIGGIYSTTAQSKHCCAYIVYSSMFNKIVSTWILSLIPLRFATWVCSNDLSLGQGVNFKLWTRDI